MDKTILERRKIVKLAIANEQLEGLIVSKESQKIADTYVAGKASVKEVSSKIRTRYGKI